MALWVVLRSSTTFHSYIAGIYHQCNLAWILSWLLFDVIHIFPIHLCGSCVSPCNASHLSLNCLVLAAVWSLHHRYHEFGFHNPYVLAAFGRLMKVYSMAISFPDPPCQRLASLTSYSWFSSQSLTSIMNICTPLPAACFETPSLHYILVLIYSATASVWLMANHPCSLCHSQPAPYMESFTDSIV